MCVTFSLPQRGSVGERFFESPANVSLIKRMKKRLSEAADFHHKAAAEADRCEVDEQPDDPDDEGVLIVVNSLEPNTQRDFQLKLVK